MRTVLTLPEQRVVLHNVSWETYERLLNEHDGCRSPRFTFDHGELEIVTLSAEHERYDMSRMADAAREGNRRRNHNDVHREGCRDGKHIEYTGVRQRQDLAKVGRPNPDRGDPIQCHQHT